MNKVLGVIAAAAVIGGVWWWMSGTQKETKENPAMMEKQDAGMMKEGEQSKGAIAPEEGMMKPEEKMMEKSGSAMMEQSAMKKSAYVPYTEEALEAAKESRRVLFFYANWCPFCKDADADFAQNMAKLPENVTVLRVNYSDTETDETEKALAKRYGITYQHSFVQIDAEGKVLASWNGGGTDMLVANIK